MPCDAVIAAMRGARSSANVCGTWLSDWVGPDVGLHFCLWNADARLRASDGGEAIVRGGLPRQGVVRRQAVPGRALSGLAACHLTGGCRARRPVRDAGGGAVVARARRLGGHRPEGASAHAVSARAPAG